MWEFTLGGNIILYNEKLLQSVYWKECTVSMQGPVLIRWPSQQSGQTVLYIRLTMHPLLSATLVPYLFANIDILLELLVVHPATGNEPFGTGSQIRLRS